MFKRRLHKLISEGEGLQLIWLLLSLFLTIAVSMGIVRLYNWNLTWQDIVGLFLDGGTFAQYKDNHAIFRLLIALIGVFIFSSLVVSVFTNIFNNLSESYKKGRTRYRFKDHVLILGANHMLKDMLIALKNQPEYQGKDIVVMTVEDVERLRDNMNALLGDKVLSRRITYYHDERCSEKHLLGACADKASAIYLIGENDEVSHDSLNLECLKSLKELCRNSTHPINCYMTVESHSSQDVIQYMARDKFPTKLRTEIISDSDYSVEQLLVETDFLPAIKETDDTYLHVVITGNSRISRSFAIVTAGICHYPNFQKGKRRTLITFMGRNMRSEMDNYVSNHKNIFDLSHYRYVSQDGVEVHGPVEGYGDFLDVEWEFVEGSVSSPHCRDILEKSSMDSHQRLVVAICSENDDTNISTALHLPEIIYKHKTPIAVYQREHSALIMEAIAGNRYGRLAFFGEPADIEDALFLRRSLRGRRVNNLYDQEYGNPPAASPDEAWASILPVHQLSSIASANSIPLKMRCFGLEPTRESVDSLSEEQWESLSEVEHRRWMMSVLLMGYKAAPYSVRRSREDFKRLKEEEYIHLDIAPYDELLHEAEKDKLIVINIPYIMTGAPVKRISQ